jgi:hypothetical protein
VAAVSKIVSGVQPAISQFFLANTQRSRRWLNRLANNAKSSQSFILQGSSARLSLQMAVFGPI